MSSAMGVTESGSGRSDNKAALRSWYHGRYMLSILGKVNAVSVYLMFGANEWANGWCKRSNPKFKHTRYRVARLLLRP